MKPTVTLTIIPRANGSTSYLLHAGSKLVWNTRAYSTPEGTDGARERLRAWLRTHLYTVVLEEGTQRERRRA